MKKSDEKICRCNFFHSSRDYLCFFLIVKYLAFRKIICMGSVHNSYKYCYRTHARLQVGTRVCELKPFYRPAKITAIGAISMNKVLALMTMNDSMDQVAFSVFIDQCLCPQLWRGAVVVMDNLPSHKVAALVPMIEAVGQVLSIYPPTLQILIPLNSGGDSLNLFYGGLLLLPQK
jgi:hypothetical protein